MGSIAMPSGGGSGKIVDLGTGSSFDVSNISGYRRFTVDNFIIGIDSFKPSGGASITQGYANSGSTSASSTATISKSYNNSTGVLTVSVSGGSASNKVNVSSGGTQWLTASCGIGSIVYHAYLIP